MAILWQKKVDNKHYEVRSAGNSVRLYTNGVFHSQWNKQRPFAGHLWDLLSLPAILCPRLEKALILGVGGGAVINVLNYFFQLKHIAAVDLDPIHLTIAQKYFLQSTENVEFICDDAQDFCEQNKKLKYDFILEDLFGSGDGEDQEAMRAVEMDEAWLNLLSKRLRKGGALVINFESYRQLKQCLPKKRIEENAFESVLSLQSPRYENAIAVCVKGECSKTILDQKLEELTEKFGAKVMRDLDFDFRKVY